MGSVPSAEAPAERIPSPVWSARLAGEIGQHPLVVGEAREAKGMRQNVRGIPSSFPKYPRDLLSSERFLNNFSRAHV